MNERAIPQGYKRLEQGAGKMKGVKHITVEEGKRIVALYVAGLPLQDIVEQSGRSSTGILKAVKRAGAPVRTPVHFKHRESYTAEYRIWTAIKHRCFCPTSDHYAFYGGRGIVMCEEWANDYSAFLRYVGRRPSPQHSLDRYPDNNGNYEPGNVRWATRLQQARNTRVNRHITAFGETRVAGQWCEDPRVVVAAQTIHWRMRRGWSPEAALTTPARGGTK